MDLFVGVASGPSGWLAVGYDGLPSKQPLVVTSQDGATWQPYLLLFTPRSAALSEAGVPPHPG